METVIVVALSAVGVILIGVLIVGYWVPLFREGPTEFNRNRRG